MHNCQGNRDTEGYPSKFVQSGRGAEGSRSKLAGRGAVVECRLANSPNELLWCSDETFSEQKRVADCSVARGVWHVYWLPVAGAFDGLTGTIRWPRTQRIDAYPSSTPTLAQPEAPTYPEFALCDVIDAVLKTDVSTGTTWPEMIYAPMRQLEAG